MSARLFLRQRYCRTQHRQPSAKILYVDIVEDDKGLTSYGTDIAEVTAHSLLEAALDLLLLQRLQDVEKNFTVNRLNVQKSRNRNGEHGACRS